jgi:hypothetical protein
VAEIAAALETNNIPQERKELIKLLVDSLEVSDVSGRRHSILELAGLGAEIWDGIDPQEYVNQLRSDSDAKEE